MISNSERAMLARLKADDCNRIADYLESLVFSLRAQAVSEQAAAAQREDLRARLRRARQMTVRLLREGESDDQAIKLTARRLDLTYEQTEANMKFEIKKRCNEHEKLLTDTIHKLRARGLTHRSIAEQAECSIGKVQRTLRRKRRNA